MDASQWMARFRFVHELIRKGGCTETASELLELALFDAVLARITSFAPQLVLRMGCSFDVPNRLIRPISAISAMSRRAARRT